MERRGKIDLSAFLFYAGVKIRYWMVRKDMKENGCEMFGNRIQILESLREFDFEKAKSVGVREEMRGMFTPDFYR
jgi:hypothetical protein